MESDSSMYYELVPPQLRSSIVMDSRMFEFGRELLSRDPELASTMSRSLASMLMMAGGDATEESQSEAEEERQSNNGDDARDREEYVFASSSSSAAASSSASSAPPTTILHSQHEASRVSLFSSAVVGESLVKAAAVDTSAEWDALRTQYPCTVCQDVMCAPHLVVECAHSFCGKCIQQHIEFNSQDSDVVCCPKCRHPIERPPCYEPDFDARILADVQSAPDCESRRYWMERHAAVMDQLARRRRQKGKKGRGEQSTASWLWETVKENMAGIIGVVALILIVVAARRSGR